MVGLAVPKEAAFLEFFSPLAELACFGCIVVLVSDSSLFSCRIYRIRFVVYRSLNLELDHA